MSSISQILVSSSDFVLDTKQNKAVFSELKENQILEAKVLRVLAEGKAQLLIQGEKIVAKTHVTLSENEMIKLKVMKTGDSHLLKMLPSAKDTALPPGMRELRTLGRAGPYSKLTQILSEQSPENRNTIQVKTLVSSLANLPVADSLSGLKTVKEISEHPILKNLLPGTKTSETQSIQLQEKFSQISGQIKSLNLTEKALSSEISVLKSFIANKNISWEHKAAAVISTRPEGTLSPEATTPAFNEKNFQKIEAGLLNILKINKFNENQSSLEKIIGSSKGSQQLTKVTEYLTGTLGSEEKILMNSVLKKSSLPWDYKMLSVLFSGEKSGSQQAVVQNIQESILSGLLGTKSEEIAGGEYKDIFQGKLPTDQVNVLRVRAFQKLEQLLELISIKQGETPDVESLKSMVKNSGLMWEKKLQALVEASDPGRLSVVERAENLINQDVKALAMKLSTAFDGEDHEIGKTIKSFVDGLEKMQLLNQHSSDESGRYLLPLPFFSESTLKFGQLFIDLDQKNETENDGKERLIRVAFILEMTQLGHLRADFSIYKKSISGEFGVETEEVKNLMDAAFPLLKTKLLEKDYVINKIACRVITPEVLAGTSLTNMVSDTGEGLLNIVI